MPHICVRCNRFHEDGSAKLLTGCDCGGKFFFYVKSTDVDTAKSIASEIPEEEKIQMEKDVFEMVGIDNKSKPVILDLESIRVTKPGQYEISLVDLFSGKPLVFRIGEGKYIIDLAGTFSKKNGKKEK
ncbi:hypothetical protein HY500_02330 [Candidatus Woesearchaeota archaeon]|nr:hypothetical protein [Candidatus Woesearchaeota archaeon]